MAGIMNPMQMCMKCHKFVMFTNLTYTHGKMMCRNCVDKMRLDELKKREEQVKRR